MQERILAACTALLAAAYFFGIYAIKVPKVGDALGPRTFPTVLAIGLLITAAILLAESRRTRRAPPASHEAVPALYLPVVLGIPVLTALYFAVLKPVGFVISTAVFLTILTTWFHPRNRLAAAISAVGFTVALYLLFAKGLSVRLPMGLLKL